MEQMQDDYLAIFAETLEKHIGEMTGLVCKKGQATVQPATLASAGVAVVIGVTGSKRGRVILDVGRETAKKLADLVDGETYDINDEFITYTIAELTNIVAGQAITVINNMEKGLSLRLTPPSIFFGDKLFLTSPKVEAKVIIVSTPEGDIGFSVGFEGGR